jgi:putative protease
VTECYSEAIDAWLKGEFTDEKKDDWDRRLATVFNRGFWDGYYTGKRLGEWNDRYGSQATETKVYVGKCTNWFSRLSVGEFLIEAAEINAGDKLMVTGNATGCITFVLVDPRVDLESVEAVPQGVAVSFRTPEKVRRGDKLYKIVPRLREES